MAYEVFVLNGKFFYKQSGELLHTSSGGKDAKWIFVLSTSKILYVGKKKKGTFQHSSFLAGGATTAAGRLIVEKGIMKVLLLKYKKLIEFTGLHCFHISRCLLSYHLSLCFNRQFGLTVDIIGLLNRTLKTLFLSLRRTMWT